MTPQEAAWRKSSHSGSNGACVEVANLGGAFGIRDSKITDSPVLTTTPASWTKFIAAVRAGRI